MEMLTFKQFLLEKPSRHCWKGYVKRGMKKKGGKLVNNCVKESDETRPILGVTEYITIDGIGSVVAKIDSGNEAYNVLHGVDITDNGDDTITFITINDKKITLPITGNIDINIGSGNIETRPTVVLNILLKNKRYKNITFSLADRAENEQQVLIGEPFIERLNALVDVKRSV
jgi:hypothetical protein